MKNTKRVLALLMTILLLAVSLCGCGNKKDTDDGEKEPQKSAAELMLEKVRASIQETINETSEEGADIEVSETTTTEDAGKRYHQITYFNFFSSTVAEDPDGEIHMIMGEVSYNDWLFVAQYAGISEEAAFDLAVQYVIAPIAAPYDGSARDLYNDVLSEVTPTLMDNGEWAYYAEIDGWSYCLFDGMSVDGTLYAVSQPLTADE